MTAGSDLHARMRESSGGLVLTIDGVVVDGFDTSSLSAPTLLVAAVHDAVKEVSPKGMVVSHLDRDATWRVLAYFLDDETSHILGSEEVSVDRIHRRVTELGLDWLARPVLEAGWEPAPDL